MKKRNCSCTQNNVDEAKCLGTTSGYGVREELYQKETGAFFLFGTGGLSSKYAKHCCGNLIPGSKIIPLTYESAQEWAKANLSPEEYETIFSQD